MIKNFKSYLVASIPLLFNGFLSIYCKNLTTTKGVYQDALIVTWSLSILGSMAMYAIAKEVFKKDA